MITGCDGLGNTCACGIRGVGIFEPLIKSRLKIQNTCTSTASKKERVRDTTKRYFMWFLVANT